MKDVRIFDLQKALAGHPVWHLAQDRLAENVTLVGESVVFTFSKFPAQVFHCGKDGKSGSRVILAMEIPTHTFYVNIWDSSSFHYTKYDTLGAAKRDTRGLSPESKSSRLHKKLNPEPIAITIED